MLAYAASCASKRVLLQTTFSSGIACKRELLQQKQWPTPHRCVRGRGLRALCAVSEPQFQAAARGDDVPAQSASLAARPPAAVGRYGWSNSPKPLCHFSLPSLVRTILHNLVLHNLVTGILNRFTRIRITAGK